MSKQVSKTESRSKKPRRSALQDVVTRDFTIHLKKRVFGVSFKKRAPKAIKAIKKFVEVNMGTTDVRLDPQLNKAVWQRGIRTVPTRIRIRVKRNRNDDQAKKEKLFCFVSHVPVTNFKGLQDQTVEDL